MAELIDQQELAQTQYADLLEGGDRSNNHRIVFQGFG